MSATPLVADDALLERARGAAPDGVFALLAEMRTVFPASLERGDAAALSDLRGLFTRIRDALLLLDRPATALISREALAVLDAFAADQLVKRPASQPEDVLQRLRGAHAALLHAVSVSNDPAYPGETGDTAIPALTVLNDLRSLRGEPLLSHALLVALDIPMQPSGTDRPVGTDGPFESITFTAAVRQARPIVMRLLVDWFRAAEGGRPRAVTAATGRLGAELETLARAAAVAGIGCSEQDLLLAAVRVSSAVAQGRLEGSGAVRRLFTLIERWLAERREVAGTTSRRASSTSQGRSDADPAPAFADQRCQTTIELLRNLLYYVAIAEPRTVRIDPGDPSSDRTATDAGAALDARYQLDRLRDSALQVTPGRADARVPTRQLRYDIVARVRAELSPIADWLAQDGMALADRQIAPRLVRLAELQSVFELLGADVCRRRLGRLRERLSGEAPLAASSRSAATRELQQLHDALDRLTSRGDRVVTHGAGRADEADRALARRLARVVTPVRKGGPDDTLLDAANAALLVEARRRLSDSGIALGTLSSSDATVSTATAVAQLRCIARALDILPRPEASALLDRLADIVGWLPSRPDGSLRAALARLVEAIDGCLGELASAQTSSDALDEAERALEALERELPASRLLVSGSSTPTVRETAGTDDGQAITEQALDAFSAIGALLCDERPVVNALAAQFGLLRRLARQVASDDLARVALAAGRRLERIAASEVSADGNRLDPVRDAHLALPQLIERLTLGAASGPGGLADLDALVDALDETPDDAFDAAHDSPLDNTLRAVFVEECSDHLDVLDQEIERALGPNGVDAAVWAPNERWLRVLHTLTGSARTADAGAIIALVEPMQHATLARQGSAASFNRDELHEFAETVAAMRDALQAFERDDMSPPLDAHGGTLHDDSHKTSLQEIFAEEANELLDRLDNVADDALPVTARRERAQSLLHTLKGSARVAGSTRLADAAHDAEDRIADADESVSPSALKRLRRELSECLAAPTTSHDIPIDRRSSGAPGRQSPSITAWRDTARERAPGIPAAPQAATERASTIESALQAVSAVVPITGGGSGAGTSSTRVRDADWERLTALAQDIGASQSRLSAELRRLREASGELDVAAQRWRRLPAAASLLETEAARELLDDLQSVRAALADCLRTVDLEQRRGARAGIALQQDLVRARLVRFDADKARLQRTLDDAAASVDKRAGLHVEGGSTTLDAALLARLLPALEHLVRNAVVHGIESSVDRRASGKPALGRVVVKASVEGMEFVVRVEDDGRGIDAGSAPRTGGALDVDADALLERIAAPGFSTLPTASGVGGRGVGLGAARERVAELGGRLSMPPVDGSGAAFEIRVPQRIPVQQVVLVRAGELIAIPVNFVAAIELPRSDESPNGPSGDSTGGSSEFGASDRVPRLADLLGAAGSNARSVDAPLEENAADAPRLLHFASPVSCQCVRVDAVIGYRELVVQPLDVQLASLDRYSGVAALADGERAFVIDPRKLTRRQPRVARAWVAPQPAPSRPLALIADDSPTLRAWTRETLSRLGFATRIARDGREALDALKELADTPPAVLVLDVDMPRVDGYGVLQTLQRSGNATFPVLVMTSRSSVRDREAALGFGAAEFLAKPSSVEALEAALQRVGVLPAGLS